MADDFRFSEMSSRLEKEMTAGAVAARISRVMSAVTVLLLLPVLLLLIVTAGAALVLALVTILGLL